MLLAKISMDIEAKHNKNNIAKWTYEDVKTKLWKIYPLSNMWGIGNNMEKNLNKMGIYTVKDLAQTDKFLLKDKFGIMGLELWNHANGIDTSIISDYKKIAMSESYSHSQVLFKDYNEENIHIIIEEMLDVLLQRLRKNNKQTKCLGLGIGYSKEEYKKFYHTIKLDNPTDTYDEIIKYLLMIFDKYHENLPIRKVTISLSSLVNKENIQMSLFDKNSNNNDNNINNVIDEIKEKYGKNSILKVANLLEDSTAIERNKKTGGHYS